MIERKPKGTPKGTPKGKPKSNRKRRGKSQRKSKRKRRRKSTASAAIVLAHFCLSIPTSGSIQHLWPRLLLAMRDGSLKQ